MIYLGDYTEDTIIDFKWSSNAADGSSITRSTNGTISVYKANSATQSTAGVTDTEDFDSLTGIHHCRIDLSADAFYATANDYAVVLSGATIDGKTVNAVLAHFSIQNRYNPTPPAASAIADAVWDEATSGHAGAGTTGKALTDANNGTAPSAADNATAVWGAGSRTLTSGAAPSAAAVADAVWDEGLADHMLADSAGESLAAAGSASSDPWNVPLPGAYTSGKAGWILGTRLDAQVSGVASGGSPGSGGSQFIYVLTETGTGDPIPDADIWATTDSAGQVVVASGRTNQQGQVIFWLDPGTVYIWRQKTGWNFTNPDTETVA
jgi:hypothetical protein